MLTTAELQANYFFYILLWIIENSTTPITDYFATGNLFQLQTDGSGNTVIYYWDSSINCDQPTDEQMKSAFTDPDYLKCKDSYYIELSTMKLPTCSNITFPSVLSNTAISPYTMIFNTDNKQLLVKSDSTNWITFTSSLSASSVIALESKTKEISRQQSFKLSSSISAPQHLNKKILTAEVDIDEDSDTVFV